MDQIRFRVARPADLDAIDLLEREAFPPAEAASLAKMTLRVEQASLLFLIAYAGDDDNIIGYICGTKTNDKKLTHESMEQHDPDGALLCIHSVVVAPEHRGRGVATKMMQAYLKHVEELGVREAALLSKEQVTPLYKKCGFKVIEKSDIVLGEDPWYEMRWTA